MRASPAARMRAFPAAMDAGSAATYAGFTCRTDAGFDFFLFPAAADAGFAATDAGFTCRNGCGLHLPQRMRAFPAATDAGFSSPWQEGPR